MRERDLRVHRRDVQVIAREKARELLPDDHKFTFSRPWATKFLQDMGFSFRRVTGSQKTNLEGTPEGEEARAIYLARIASVADAFGIKPGMLFNADETNPELLPSSTTTFAKKGSKNVHLQDADDKRQVTVMLGGNDTGTQHFPPFIIFGKAQNVLPSTAGTNAIVTSTSNHWMQEDALKQWVEEVVVPAWKHECFRQRLDPAVEHAILTFDVAAVHRSSSTIQWLHENYPRLHLVFVPAGCTSFLQVADVAINKPFKDHIANSKAEWERSILGSKDIAASEAAAKKKEASRLPRLRRLCVEWCFNAWLHLDTMDLLAKGAERIGIAEAMDPSLRAKHLLLAHEMGDALWNPRTRFDVVIRRGNGSEVRRRKTKKQLEEEAKEQRRAQITENGSSVMSIGPRRRDQRRGARPCKLCGQLGHYAKTCARRKNLEATSPAPVRRERPTSPEEEPSAKRRRTG